jgi:hypothetical protein
MPNKFSFNRLKLYYQLQDLNNSANKTIANFNNTVNSLGLKTEEKAEKSQQLEKDKKAALEKSSKI